MLRMDIGFHVVVLPVCEGFVNIHICDLCAHSHIRNAVSSSHVVGPLCKLQETDPKKREGHSTHCTV